MAKRAKGLSFDQKRQKMLKIFHTTIEVYNLAEIQKLGMKAGIVLPSIKQVLESLKADDLVNSDKIGAGNFYWSFPSKTHQIIIEKVEQQKSKIIKLKQLKQSLIKSIQEQKKGREQTEQRKQLQSELNLIKEQRQKLKRAMEKYIRFDPQRVELLKKQNQQIMKMANFWTDNIYQLVKYIKKNSPGITNQAIQQMYEIAPELDYLENV